MSVVEQRTKVLSFIEQWRGHGDEKQETQRFWLDLLQNVLGVRDAINQTLFEYRTVGGGFIDVLCPEARLLVEQKSGDIDLDKPEPRQGTMVTPVQQALRYADALPYSMKPAGTVHMQLQHVPLLRLGEGPTCYRGASRRVHAGGIG